MDGITLSDIIEKWFATNSSEYRVERYDDNIENKRNGDWQACIVITTDGHQQFIARISDDTVYTFGMFGIHNVNLSAADPKFFEKLDAALKVSAESARIYERAHPGHNRWIAK